MKNSPQVHPSHTCALAATSGQKRANVVEAPPTLTEASRRLAAARGRPQPWLTSTAIEVAGGMPEVIGPKTYRKP
jgi:hypothetical protein